MKQAISKERIRLILAEDHIVVREGLKTLLEAEKDIIVVGEADNGRQAVELTKKLRPTVVVMDIAMSQLNGIAATRQILKTVPDTRILILSAHGEDAYVDHATASGANGFLLKQSSAHVLVRAVREIAKGNSFFSPAIVNRLRKVRKAPANRAGTPGTQAVHLSPRETEVLQLIAEGLANKQTAAELKISVKTVEKHRQRLMEKLNIHDTAGLTRYAIATGIIENSVQLTIV